jgi:hypothetical protein
VQPSDQHQQRQVDRRQVPGEPGGQVDAGDRSAGGAGEVAPPRLRLRQPPRSGRRARRTWPAVPGAGPNAGRCTPGAARTRTAPGAPASGAGSRRPGPRGGHRAWRRVSVAAVSMGSPWTTGGAEGRGSGPPRWGLRPLGRQKPDSHAGGMATRTAFPRRSRTSDSGDERARAGAERSVWRRWVVATTLGELIGFLIPVAVVSVGRRPGTRSGAPAAHGAGRRG